ncbi:MAG: cobalamin B12-binding domain-containing protein [Candidatus Lokiarchaeota archaeon]|nr:cobalamin B12-binding domain-containing protein [Candidatus Lokiarchaeota archaeon]
MIDVLLINPYQRKRISLASYRDKIKFPVLSLLSLASYLEKEGFKVEILDLNIKALKNKNILRVIKEKNPIIIGITSITTSIYEAYRLARLIKANFNATLIIGGPHATFSDEEILNESTFDIVVRGEGEEILSEIVRTIKREQKLDDIKGISYKKDGKVIRNESREFIVDLDKLPFPARNLVPLEKYGTHAFTIITSRGCPFGCKFCQVPGKDGLKWRHRSAANIIEEIKEVLKKYPNMKKVSGPEGKRPIAFFVDDNFMVSIERIEEICNKIIEEGIEIYWDANARVDTIANISEDLLDLFKKSGCLHIFLGVESGSEKTLKSYNKQIKKQDALKSAERLKKKGIFFTGAFMLGYIQEKKTDLNATIQFAKKMDPTIVAFRILIPLPGTKIYEKYIKEDLIMDFNYSNYTSGIQIIKHEENLERWVLKGYLMYYLRPRKEYLDIGMWKMVLQIYS